MAIAIIGLAFIFLSNPETTSKSLSKCGDGICDEKEKANSKLCPKDCEKKPEGTCEDLCGDGTCQEVVCEAIGCPCAETSESCPEDCQPTAGKCPQIMPPSLILEEQCEKDGGKLEPRKNEKGCITGYECKTETGTIPCQENWQCANWSACSDNQQTRTCTDKNNCGTVNNRPSESMSCGETEEKISSLNLLEKVEIVNGARPEIAVTKDRVFVVYLEPSMSGNAFKVKIFDRDLTKEIASETPVTKSSQYGNPTDIRVVSDGTYLYAFYETAGSDKSYLFGAKYTLDDKFERIAYQGPIATSTMFKVAKPGDEKLDDPAPMLEGDNVYVMTRFKSTLAKEGETRYKLYKFDKNLNKQSEFELDLSAYADGEARQSSIIYENGYYYIAMQTTVGSGNIIETVEWTAPSDILMVRLDKDWRVKEAKIIASEPGYTEAYVTGLKSDANYLYVTYNQVILGKEFSSIIKIYDKNWNVVLTNKYKTGTKALRPSLEITTDRVYAGNDEEGAQKAEIHIFEKK